MVRVPGDLSGGTALLPAALWARHAVATPLYWDGDDGGNDAAAAAADGVDVVATRPTVPLPPLELPPAVGIAFRRRPQAAGSAATMPQQPGQRVAAAGGAGMSSSTGDSSSGPTAPAVEAVAAADAASLCSQEGFASIAAVPAGAPIAVRRQLESRAFKQVAALPGGTTLYALPRGDAAIAAGVADALEDVSGAGAAGAGGASSAHGGSEQKGGRATRLSLPSLQAGYQRDARNDSKHAAKVDVERRRAAALEQALMQELKLSPAAAAIAAALAVPLITDFRVTVASLPARLADAAASSRDVANAGLADLIAAAVKARQGQVPAGQSWEPQPMPAKPGPIVPASVRKLTAASATAAQRRGGINASMLVTAADAAAGNGDDDDDALDEDDAAAPDAAARLLHSGGVDGGAVSDLTAAILAAAEAAGSSAAPQNSAAASASGASASAMGAVDPVAAEQVTAAAQAVCSVSRLLARLLPSQALLSAFHRNPDASAGGTGAAAAIEAALGSAAANTAGVATAEWLAAGVWTTPHPERSGSAAGVGAGAGTPGSARSHFSAGSGASGGSGGPEEPQVLTVCLWMQRVRASPAVEVALRSIIQRAAVAAAEAVLLQPPDGAVTRTTSAAIVPRPMPSSAGGTANADGSRSARGSVSGLSGQQLAASTAVSALLHGTILIDVAALADLRLTRAQIEIAGAPDAELRAKAAVALALPPAAAARGQPALLCASVETPDPAEPPALPEDAGSGAEAEPVWRWQPPEGLAITVDEAHPSSEPAAQNSDASSATRLKSSGCPLLLPLRVQATAAPGKPGRAVSASAAADMAVALANGDSNALAAGTGVLATNGTLALPSLVAVKSRETARAQLQALAALERMLAAAIVTITLFATSRQHPPQEPDHKPAPADGSKPSGVASSAAVASAAGAAPAVRTVDLGTVTLPLLPLLRRRVFAELSQPGGGSSSGSQADWTARLRQQLQWLPIHRPNSGGPKPVVCGEVCLAAIWLPLASASIIVPPPPPPPPAPVAVPEPQAAAPPPPPPKLLVSEGTQTDAPPAAAPAGPPVFADQPWHAQLPRCKGLEDREAALLRALRTVLLLPHPRRALTGSAITAASVSMSTLSIAIRALTETDVRGTGCVTGRQLLQALRAAEAAWEPHISGAVRVDATMMRSSSSSGGESISRSRLVLAAARAAFAELQRAGPVDLLTLLHRLPSLASCDSAEEQELSHGTHSIGPHAFGFAALSDAPVDWVSLRHLAALPENALDATLPALPLSAECPDAGSPSTAEADAGGSADSGGWDLAVEAPLAARCVWLQCARLRRQLRLHLTGAPGLSASDLRSTSLRRTSLAARDTPPSALSPAAAAVPVADLLAALRAAVYLHGAVAEKAAVAKAAAAASAASSPSASPVSALHSTSEESRSGSKLSGGTQTQAPDAESAAAQSGSASSDAPFVAFLGNALAAIGAAVAPSELLLLLSCSGALPAGAAPPPLPLRVALPVTELQALLQRILGLSARVSFVGGLMTGEIFDSKDAAAATGADALAIARPIPAAGAESLALTLLANAAAAAARESARAACRWLPPLSPLPLSAYTPAELRLRHALRSSRRFLAHLPLLQATARPLQLSDAGGSSSSSSLQPAFAVPVPAIIMADLAWACGSDSSDDSLAPWGVQLPPALAATSGSPLISPDLWRLISKRCTQLETAANAATTGAAGLRARKGLAPSPPQLAFEDDSEGSDDVSAAEPVIVSAAGPGSHDATVFAPALPPAVSARAFLALYLDLAQDELAALQARVRTYVEGVVARAAAAAAAQASMRVSRANMPHHLAGVGAADALAVDGNAVDLALVGSGGASVRLSPTDAKAKHSSGTTMRGSRAGGLLDAASSGEPDGSNGFDFVEGLVESFALLAVRSADVQETARLAAGQIDAAAFALLGRADGASTSMSATNASSAAAAAFASAASVRLVTLTSRQVALASQDAALPLSPPELLLLARAFAPSRALLPPHQPSSAGAAAATAAAGLRALPLHSFAEDHSTAGGSSGGGLMQSSAAGTGAGAPGAFAGLTGVRGVVETELALARAGAPRLDNFYASPLPQPQPLPQIQLVAASAPVAADAATAASAVEAEAAGAAAGAAAVAATAAANAASLSALSQPRLQPLQVTASIAGAPAAFEVALEPLLLCLLGRRYTELKGRQAVRAHLAAAAAERARRSDAPEVRPPKAGSSLASASGGADETALLAGLTGLTGFSRGSHAESHDSEAAFRWRQPEWVPAALQLRMLPRALAPPPPPPAAEAAGPAKASASAAAESEPAPKADAVKDIAPTAAAAAAPSDAIAALLAQLAALAGAAGGAATGIDASATASDAAIKALLERLEPALARAVEPLLRSANALQRLVLLQLLGGHAAPQAGATKADADSKAIKPEASATPAVPSLQYTRRGPFRLVEVPPPPVPSENAPPPSTKDKAPPLVQTQALEDEDDEEEVVALPIDGRWRCPRCIHKQILAFAPTCELCYISCPFKVKATAASSGGATGAGPGSSSAASRSAGGGDAADAGADALTELNWACGACGFANAPRPGRCLLCSAAVRAPMRGVASVDAKPRSSAKAAEASLATRAGTITQNGTPQRRKQGGAATEAPSSPSSQASDDTDSPPASPPSPPQPAPGTTVAYVRTTVEIPRPFSSGDGATRSLFGAEGNGSGSSGGAHQAAAAAQQQRYLPIGFARSGSGASGYMAALTAGGSGVAAPLPVAAAPPAPGETWRASWSASWSAAPGMPAGGASSAALASTSTAPQSSGYSGLPRPGSSGSATTALLMARAQLSASTLAANRVPAAATLPGGSLSLSGADGGAACSTASHAMAGSFAASPWTTRLSSTVSASTTAAASAAAAAASQARSSAGAALALGPFLPAPVATASQAGGFASAGPLRW